MNFADRQASILIVEDEQLVALDLEQSLVEMFYRVVGRVDNGRAAIALASEHRPDLVLMDIMLKGDMDGVEAARQIGQVVGAPIIFLTAYSDTHTVGRAAETAPHGFVTKPFQPRELRAAIEVALYKSRVERRLRETERWFSATLNCVADAVIATDREGRVTFLNPIAERLTEWSVADALGRDVDEVLSRETMGEIKELRSPLKLALTANEPIGSRYGAALIGRRGTRVPIDDSAAPIRGEDSQVIGAVAVFRDVSERLQHEQQLRASEERFRKVFELSAVGMVLVSLNGEILRANASFKKLIGQSEDPLVGYRIRDLTESMDAEREGLLLKDLINGGTSAVQLEKRYLHRDGNRCVWTLTVVSLLTEHQGPMYFLYQVNDLTERKEAEAQLERLAYYDPLTGLSNRTHLRHELERLLATARRHSEPLAVVFIDLDRFKQINDTLGHEVGDLLLETVAERLRSVLRESDCVGRQGGDEFVLVLPGINTPRKVASIAEKLRRVVSKPMLIAGHSLTVTPSIGVSLFPIDGEDSQTLLRNADAALYAAKAEGRNIVQFFRPELTEQVRERLDLESALRSAAVSSQFLLEYQPLVRPSDSRIVAFEALIRWNRGGTHIAPAKFIPVAEETGLIVPIGEWVLHEACSTAARWPEHIVLNVNCSPKQFQDPSLFGAVSKALSRNGMHPRRLCLEVTEDVMLASSPSQATNFRKLQELGVTLSIDDYGTGYSSLAYLKRFEPKSLKIDRLFVSDMIEDAASTAIVTATIAMAHSLGLKAVAEGVETAEQAAFLCAEGCDMAQGFHYSRPVGAETVAALLRNEDPVALSA